MGRFVIVAYTPKPGKEEQLLAVVKKHLDVLAAENLITDRPGYVMRAVDVSIVEVFEWRSAAAIAQAHTNDEWIAIAELERGVGFYRGFLESL